jgi:hypothetical protein
MVTMTRPASLCFLLSLILVAVSAQEEGEPAITETCPICTFTVEKEPEGCKVYGLSPRGGDEEGSGELTAWHHAIRPCLEGLNTENLTMSQAELYDFCPNATINNETGRVDDVNIDTFINLVRDDPQRPEALAIFTLFEDRAYFVKNEGGGENGTLYTVTYSLNETFLNPQGVLHNCTETPSFCWNDIKTDMRGREKRLLKVCTEWHTTRKALLIAEQRWARIRICNKLDGVVSSQQSSSNGTNDGDDDAAIPEYCEDLVEQIKAQKLAFPDAECDAFGKGLSGQALPTCAADGGVGASGASSGAGPSSIIHASRRHGAVIAARTMTALVSSLLLLGWI